MGDGAEAESAKRLLLANLERAGVHPSQVTLYGKTGEGLYGASTRLLEQQDKRIAELSRVNRFLIGKVDRNVVLQARKAGEIDYQGYALDEAFERLFGDLSTGWENRAARHLEVTMAQLRRWREGVEEIPPEVFAKITPKKREPRSKTQVDEKDRFNWSQVPDLELAVIDMFFKGEKSLVIAAMIQTEHGLYISDASIRAKATRNPPPASMNTEVQKSGPLTWEEAWEISATLYPKESNWAKPLKKLLGFNEQKAQFTKLAEKADPQAIARLRNLYFDHIERHGKPNNLSRRRVWH